MVVQEKQTLVEGTSWRQRLVSGGGTANAGTVISGTHLADFLARHVEKGIRGDGENEGSGWVDTMDILLFPCVLVWLGSIHEWTEGEG